VLTAVSHAWHSWKSAKAVALFAIVALVVGIGSTTAIYAVVRGVMLAPRPYANGDRFVAMSVIASSPAPAAGRAPANAARAKGENVALITIEFRGGSRCTVTILDESLTSDQVDDVPGPGSASEYRCPIRSRPRGRPIALTVVLPSGEVPAGADFPRLAWTVRDTHWIGIASLPSAPAFVRVPTSGSGASRRVRLLDWAALAATAIAVAWTLVYSAVIRN